MEKSPLAVVVATAADAEAYLDRLADFARVLDAENAVQEEGAKRGRLAPAFALDLALGQMAALRKPAVLPRPRRIFSSPRLRSADTSARLKNAWA